MRRRAPRRSKHATHFCNQVEREPHQHAQGRFLSPVPEPDLTKCIVALGACAFAASPAGCTLLFDVSSLETPAAADAGSASASDASCAPYVLSPMPTVGASSFRSTNYANQAIDKSFMTRWESLQQADEPDGGMLPPQWISLDFGRSTVITRVQIDWSDSCAQTYELQVSADGTSWTTMPGGSVVGNTSGSRSAPSDWSTSVDTQGLSGVGRYLRVYATARCRISYGYSIWEIQVWGHGVSSCDGGT